MSSISLRERPTHERCNLCDEWTKEGIENYVEHLKVCRRTKLDEPKNDPIDQYSCKGDPYKENYEVTGVDGLKQTFAMYFYPYAKTRYYRQKIVKLTRTGAIVSLSSFYDIGRIPLTIGWGNGRVAWTGQKGSKWFNFRTWSGFRWRVFLRDNGVCQKCGKVLATKDENGRWPYQPEYVCDHIVPLFKGGKDWHEDDEMSNFQTLCVDCNKVKTRHDVAKPHVIKQKLGLKTIQYAGFVFEQPEQKNTLDLFLHARYTDNPKT